jgi:hypothetical protein
LTVTAPVAAVGAGVTVAFDPDDEGGEDADDEPAPLVGVAESDVEPVVELPASAPAGDVGWSGVLKLISRTSASAVVTRAMAPRFGNMGAGLRSRVRTRAKTRRGS